MPREIDYSLLPEHISDSVKLYIEEGRPTGDFLQSVICNQLKESFAFADDINIERMFDIVSFFYNQAPLLCWGSRKRMEKWTGHSGLKGLQNESHDA